MKNLNCLKLFFLFFLFSGTESKKIISIEFVGSKSHVITYLSLLNEMSQRGHQVTLVAPCKGLSIDKNIRQIQTIDLTKIVSGKKGMSIFALKEANQSPNPFPILKESLPTHCKELYERPDIQALLQETFDLVLLQPIFNECSFGLVKRIMEKGASLVLFSPAGAPSFVIEPSGGFYPPSFVSNLFLGFRDDMSFKERFINVGFSIMFDAIYKWNYCPVMEAVYREELGEDLPSAREILGEASLILSNGHYSINKPKPNLPNVVDVGGIHSRDAKPLPKDLEAFIEKGGEEGFILFSLGTNIKGDEMPEGKLKMFLKVFSRLKQRVIWKFESNMTSIPENVLLVNWLPQQDLLGHGKIKMFIFHCGGGGTEESIYHGVPLIGMPFFGDQPLNCKMAENLGILYYMEWNELTEDYLSNGINEVLSNPKYLENVQKISMEFRDQINKPLDRGVWWLEYVMRSKGAPLLQSAAKNLNYFQYHSLDVLAVYLVLVSLPLWIIWKLFLFVVSKCRGGESQRTNIKKGKKQN